MAKRQSPTVRATKNVFSLTQMKKMMGKKLIMPWKGLVIVSQIKADAKKIKELIIAQHEKNKQIIIPCVCVNGVLQVIGGVDKFMAISSISYDDIKKHNLQDVLVTILQYPQMTHAEIKKRFI